MRRTSTSAHRLLQTLIVVVVLSRSASAQSAGCTAADCPLAPAQLQAATTKIDGLRQEFAASVARFTVTIAAVTADDEGIRSTIASMGDALARWDEAIRALEASAPQASRTPDVHIAVGKAYANRHRLTDALREFEEAARQDPTRVDARLWSALAHAASDRPAEAARAFVEATALDVDDPTLYYRLARQQTKTGQAQESREALRMFRERLGKRLAQSDKQRVPSTPFERLEILAVPGAVPTFPPDSYANGFVLLGRGSYEEAVASFRQTAVREARGSSDAAREPLSSGRASMRQGDLTSAIRHLEDAARAAPGASEVHRILGAVYSADGQIDRSIEEFKAALRATPTDERSWTALADVLAAQGLFTEVEPVLNAAIQSVPGSAQLRYSLGRLYQSLGKYSEAAGSFEKALSPGPLVGRDALYTTIGDTYVTLADYARASQAWTRRIDVDPNNADAHRRLGEAYLRLDRDEEALAEFLCALWIDPRNADAEGSVARLHLRSGRYAEAAEASGRAIELDPTLKEARYISGTALMRLGRVQEGASQLEEFERLQAEATAHGARDHVLERLKRDAAVSIAMGDYQKAAGVLREAVSLEPDVASTHLAFGFVLMETGHHSEAIVSLQNASRLGAVADVHRYLAEAYRALGRLDESRAASEAYRQAIQRLKRERLLQLGQIPQ